MAASRLWKLAWASPWTLLGLAIGVVGLASGGRAQRIGGAIEFSGGAAAWLLRHAPLLRGAAAVTFGHVILGQTPADLDACRSHEHVHVRQYERWGAAFIPAYLACSLWLWLRGRNWYLENPFEIQAYRDA